MARVEAPSVGNTMLSCCGHEETHTPVVLGGTVNVICVGAMWSPTCTDDGVIVNKAFRSEGRVGCLVEIEKLLTSLLADLLGSRQENQTRFSLSSTCGKKSSQSCRGQSLSTVASAAMKCSLNVVMAHLAALTQWL